MLSPPQFVDVAVIPLVDHVLGALGGERIAVGVGEVGCRWCAGGRAEVVVMPAVGIPPQFVDVLVAASVDHVLSALGHEDVALRRSGVTGDCWCAGGGA